MAIAWFKSAELRKRHGQSHVDALVNLSLLAKSPTVRPLQGLPVTFARSESTSWAAKHEKPLRNHVHANATRQSVPLWLIQSWALHSKSSGAHWARNTLKRRVCLCERMRKAHKLLHQSIHCRSWCTSKGWRTVRINIDQFQAEPRLARDLARNPGWASCKGEMIWANVCF